MDCGNGIILGPKSVARVTARVASKGMNALGNPELLNILDGDVSTCMSFRN
jgi:hypothetical protein